MSNHLRNLRTGEIKTVDPDSAEFHKLKAERDEATGFPLWEQTGAHDADPKNASSDYEVENRSRFDADIADVTTDGVLQSGEHQLGGNGSPFAEAASSSRSSSSGSSSKS
jgi:hypothetical protein